MSSLFYQLHNFLRASCLLLAFRFLSYRTRLKVHTHGFGKVHSQTHSQPSLRPVWTLACVHFMRRIDTTSHPTSPPNLGPQQNVVCRNVHFIHFICTRTSSGPLHTPHVLAATLCDCEVVNPFTPFTYHRKHSTTVLDKRMRSRKCETHTDEHV